MALRCYKCKSNTKLDKNQVWYEWKCDTFHKTSACPLGDKCLKMHIYYSKIQARKSIAAWRDNNSDSDESTAYGSAGGTDTTKMSDTDSIEGGPSDSSDCISEASTEQSDIPGLPDDIAVQLAAIA